MGRLEYDSSAFAYWTFAALLAFVAPASYFWRKDLQFMTGTGKQQHEATIQHIHNLPGPAYVKLARIGKVEEAYAKKRKGATTKTALLAIGSVFLLLFFFTVGGGGEQIAQFDPFEVLGISAFATETEIKKAYRQLSLKWHPDRWSTADKEQQSIAEGRFVRVAKAYSALTDEIAKENYKKYGNPDGRQALEMSIGLPAFLLDPSSQFFVVGCYLMLILIILPSLVLLWTKDTASTTSDVIEVDKFGPESIDPDTQEVFRVSIKKQVSFPEAIDIFATSAEFRPLEYRDEEERQILKSLHANLANKKLMPKEVNFVARNLGCFHDGNEIACILVYAHLSRAVDTLTPNLTRDLVFVLFHAFPLLRLMIDHARTTCFMPSLMVTIRLLQCFTQAVGPETVPFFQAPGFDNPAEAEVLFKAVSSKAKKDTNLFLECLNLNPSDFGAEKQEKAAMLQKFVQRIPLRKLTAKIGTTSKVTKSGGKKKEDDIRRHQYEWEPFSAVGDMVRVVCSAELVNPTMTPAGMASAVDNGFPTARVASAPFIPFDVTEQWFFVLTNGPSPRGMHIIPAGETKVVAYGVMPEDGEQNVMCDLKFLTINSPNDWMSSADWPAKQNHELKLYIFNSAYVGLESMCVLKIMLEEPNKVTKFKYHPEDQSLGQPTTLYSLLGQEQAVEVDSDFDDGEKKDEESDVDEVDVPADIQADD